MKADLSPDEFISRAIGLPWARWRSDWLGADCYGLVILWFRHVRGIELGEVPQTDVADGFAHSKCWIECEPCEGATMWMAWRDGAPHHVGMLVGGGMVLHTDGTEAAPGGARLNRLEVVTRIYGQAKFYRYEAC